MLFNLIKIVSGLRTELTTILNEDLVSGSESLDLCNQNITNEELVEIASLFKNSKFK